MGFLFFLSLKLHCLSSKDSFLAALLLLASRALLEVGGSGGGVRLIRQALVTTGVAGVWR